MNLKELKNKHTETNNTITEIKNSLEGILDRKSTRLNSVTFISGKTNKQTKIQYKSHPIQTLHKPLDQPYEGRNQKEERIQPLILEKGELKHSKFKKK